MRIEIDPSAANDPDAHPCLDRILHWIEDGWHVWDTTDQPDPGDMEATTWIRDRDRQGVWVRELLVASIQRSAWTLAPHGRSVRVTTHPRTPKELTPENAFQLADEPLCIPDCCINVRQIYVKRRRSVLREHAGALFRAFR